MKKENTFSSVLFWWYYGIIVALSRQALNLRMLFKLVFVIIQISYALQKFRFLSCLVAAPSPSSAIYNTYQQYLSPHSVIKFNDGLEWLVVIIYSTI